MKVRRTEPGRRGERNASPARLSAPRVLAAATRPRARRPRGVHRWPPRAICHAPVLSYNPPSSTTNLEAPFATRRGDAQAGNSASGPRRARHTNRHEGAPSSRASSHGRADSSGKLCLRARPGVAGGVDVALAAEHAQHTQPRRRPPLHLEHARAPKPRWRAAEHPAGWRTRASDPGSSRLRRPART